MNKSFLGNDMQYFFIVIILVHYISFTPRGKIYEYYREFCHTYVLIFFSTKFNCYLFF